MRCEGSRVETGLLRLPESASSSARYPSTQRVMKGLYKTSEEVIHVLGLTFAMKNAKIVSQHFVSTEEETSFK